MYLTKRTALGEKQDVRGWEPFANGGNGQSVLWRRCADSFSEREVAHARARDVKQVTLGSREAVAAAASVLGGWIHKVVAFDMMRSAPKVGRLERVEGTTATVVIDGKRTTINLLEVRSALRE